MKKHKKRQSKLSKAHREKSTPFIIIGLRMTLGSVLR
jgi:hypothetical protein